MYILDPLNAVPSNYDIKDSKDMGLENYSLWQFDMEITKRKKYQKKPTLKTLHILTILCLINICEAYWEIRKKTWFRIMHIKILQMLRDILLLFPAKVSLYDN